MIENDCLSLQLDKDFATKWVQTDAYEKVATKNDVGVQSQPCLQDVLV